MTITYYAVYGSEEETADPPAGLFRRAFDDAGRPTRSESYHPDYGWSHTGHWVDVERGEDDLHLVEVDEARADVIRAYFDAKYAGPDRPQSRPCSPSRLSRAVRGVLGREPRER